MLDADPRPLSPFRARRSRPGERIGAMARRASADRYRARKPEQLLATARHDFASQLERHFDNIFPGARLA
jgi:hypothetical protein